MSTVSSIDCLLGANAITIVTEGLDSLHPVHALYVLPLIGAAVVFLAARSKNRASLGVPPVVPAIAACALIAFGWRALCLKTSSQRYFYIFVPLCVFILCAILDRWLSEGGRRLRIFALAIMATIFIGSTVACLRIKNSYRSLTAYAREIRRLKQDPALPRAILNTRDRAAQLAWKAGCAFLEVPHKTSVTDAKSAEALLAQYRCTNFDLVLPVDHALAPGASGAEIAIPSGKLIQIAADMRKSKWRLRLYRFVPQSRPEICSEAGKDAVSMPHGDFEETANGGAAGWTVSGGGYVEIHPAVSQVSVIAPSPFGSGKALRLTTSGRICVCSDIFVPVREPRRFGYSVQGRIGTKYDIMVFGRGKKHTKRFLFSGCLTTDRPIDVKLPFEIADLPEPRVQIAVVVDHGELTIDRLYYE